MAKFTYASGAMLLPNLVQVTESISGSVVPLAMFCIAHGDGGDHYPPPILYLCFVLVFVFVFCVCIYVLYLCFYVLFVLFDGMVRMATVVTIILLHLRSATLSTALPLRPA